MKGDRDMAHNADNAAPLWHTLDADAAAFALESGPDGLSAAEAVRRLGQYGPNALPQPKRPGLARVYLRQFKSPLIFLLLAAAAVSIAIGEAGDALFIFGVLQINATIGTVQEWKAQKSTESLAGMIQSRIGVLRDGVRQDLDSRDLVPGDVVSLETGNLVPADMRLMTVADARVDESRLTGESEPVEKDAAARLDAGVAVADRINMLYAASTLTGGRAKGIVVATGLETQMGQIARALAGEDVRPPPLVMRLERLTWMIGSLIMAVIVVLAAAEFLRGAPLAEIFLLAVALAVAAIPEGLPVAITIALAVGTARMAKRNVIVRALPAVEGLGSCTLIASDKTGTMTVNTLTVKRLYLPAVGDLDVGGEGYVPVGDIRLADGGVPDGAARAGVRNICESGVLCNEASLTVDGDTLHHQGDTVDVAFLALADKAGVDRGLLAAAHPQVAAIPYESADRMAASLNRGEDGGADTVVHVKGAAETVLPMCAGVDEAALLDEAARLARAGFRVLAVARGPVSLAADARLHHADLKNLTFLGLVGLIDPLRPEAFDAVAKCQDAGIDVRMITGDHPVTALAIARDLGIATAEVEVVTGMDLQALADGSPQKDRLIARARIFARVTPDQKLDIVSVLGRLGHFVAVTGDGVNDAPALRAAHIGVAMGKTGTDVAREAADLILTDDNFASIVGGVEAGRVAYDNVRKVVYLLVSTGAAEIMLFFLALIVGTPLPLFAVQLLWLNLVTQGLQHVALALEGKEPDILERRPRPPNQPIFDRRMIEETIVSGIYIGLMAFTLFKIMLDLGVTESYARNLLFLFLVMFENVHVFNCRSETQSFLRQPLRANRFLLIAVIGSQLTHIAAMYVPGFRDILRIEPVSFGEWGGLMLLASSALLVMEAYKFVRRRHPI